MTTMQMKLFIAAATCLNFTETANAFFISPSSLTRQISAIERELNLQLFYRNNRSVRLTPAGKVLLEELTQVYDAYLHSVARAQEVQHGQSSSLNIGILDGHTVSGQFPQIIAQMERQHPDILINLFRGSFGDLSHALYDKTADLIITLEFSLQKREQLQILPLNRTKDYLAMLRTNPLARKPILTAADFRDEVFIEVSQEDSLFTHHMASSAQRLLGFQVKSAPNLETCTLWIQAGLGISIINSHNYLADDPKLYFIDLDQVEAPGLVPVNSDLVLSWHPANLNPALPIFLEVCQDFVKVSPPPVPSNLRRLSDSI